MPRAMKKYRVELRVIVREIWEVEAEDASEAELGYITDPDAFIFDREDVESDVVRVYEVK
ncbi:hypothetical protein [Antarcticirhabdus aurantiaca]|uniref:Uncharacterized protein n=1 Tax=Antarcticirhabdus aurantiaca TaxID=2606717 RepID=A0ACD4NRK5_9HYPH|nr:hypothetical protein [Antarcticirhabdus aurantiaca]WAJ29446.1 hypothetical protein OXU80_04195 [Jeongeuplla avenae]